VKPPVFNADKIDIDEKFGDFITQFEMLGTLKNGWYNGEGKAADKIALEWLKNSFQFFYDHKLPYPNLYLTQEGDVLAEWSFSNLHDISLEINLIDKTGMFDCLNLETGKSLDVEDKLYLSDKSGWVVLNSNICKVYIINDKI
jgi:hypothetical protein